MNAPNLRYFFPSIFSSFSLLCRFICFAVSIFVSCIFSRAPTVYYRLYIPYIEWDLRLCIMYNLYGEFFFSTCQNTVSPNNLEFLPINQKKKYAQNQFAIHSYWLFTLACGFIFKISTRKNSTYLHTFFSLLSNEYIYLAAHFIQNWTERHISSTNKQFTVCYVYLAFSWLWRESREFHSNIHLDIT